MTTPVEMLVASLQKANWAYHNTDTPIMTDEDYDTKLEELRRLSPAHPFLSVIGATPSAKGSSILLPYTMASLNKVRYGEGALARWVGKFPGKRIVCTEKLDGLSALLITSKAGKQSLYLRGDGVKGVDVSRALEDGGLKVPRVPGIYRGEVLLSNEKTPAGSIGRSLVNGWLHRCLDSSGPLPPELSECHFVAYQILEPAVGSPLPRSQQLSWLQTRGFRIPRWKMFEGGELNEEGAKGILTTWRAESVYPLDGIVLGVDSIPVASPGGEARNPEDAVAFKASLEEQKRETTITTVEWNLSRQGLWIPTLVIEPVEIGGARIGRLSAHNAATVEKEGLGPGTRIVVRRSGDVIPTLDSVVTVGGQGALMPSKGSWEWDKNHVHAVLAKDTDIGGAEAAAKSIAHCLTTLGVEGVGPGLVSKIVEEGMMTMKDVWEADTTLLAKALGPGRGPALSAALKASVAKANQMTLLIASNLLPRGIGEKKLRTLYAIESDARKWSMGSLGTPVGWSSESLQGLLHVLPAALAWSERTFGTVEVSVPSTKSSPGPSPSPSTPLRYVVFTGCRLGKEALPAGWEMEDSVTKKTTLLVVADDALEKETTKTKKAKAQGVEIVTLTKFKSML